MYRRFKDKSQDCSLPWQSTECTSTIIQIHPTSDYDHLTTELKQLYEKFEFHDIYRKHTLRTST
eukprot:6482529-Amphidinium_carterae.3